MQQLTVIGSEGDALIVATESGERFTLPADTGLRAELKRIQQRQERTSDRGPRPNPRDIQTRVRAGLTAVQIAEALQISLEDVQRYEGPVLAEREHIVSQALAVPVLTASTLEDGAVTFGTAVRAKLAEAQAVGERWTSWRDEDGWNVKVEFTAAEVDHDARWGFDPRRLTLTPRNADANQLSRQGSLPEGLIPRLRALEDPHADAAAPEPEPAGPRRIAPAAQAPEADPASRAAQDAAIKRAPAAAHTTSETADLLEALRRRRGQREPLPAVQQEDAEPAAPVALFDALEPGYEPPAEPAAAAVQVHAEAAGDEQPRRKGRTAMPSWDEIVFGARTEES